MNHKKSLSLSFKPSSSSLSFKPSSQSSSQSTKRYEMLSKEYNQLWSKYNKMQSNLNAQKKGITFDESEKIYSRLKYIRSLMNKRYIKSSLSDK